MALQVIDRQINHIKKQESLNSNCLAWSLLMKMCLHKLISMEVNVHVYYDEMVIS